MRPGPHAVARYWGAARIGQIFLKLELRGGEGEDRRVAAVLAYLRAAQPG